MKIIFFALITASCSLFAQDKKDAQPAKTGVSVSTRTVSQPAQEQKNSQPKLSPVSIQASTITAKVNISTAAAKPEKQEVKKDDDEYSEVMTDVMETQTYSFYPSADEQQEKEIVQPIPLTYGKVKGAMTETGKNYLVLENEDGEIYILNVYTDKNGIFSWKLSGKFERN